MRLSAIHLPLPRINALQLVLAGLLLACPMFGATDVDLGAGATTGAIELESIGPMTFGDKGVLFVADSTAATIYALDTGDQMAATGESEVAIENLDAKIAALLGTTADDIQIHDLAVNPASQALYLTVSRGQGDEAQHAIVKTSSVGEFELVDLRSIRYAKVDLRDAPGLDATDRRGRPLRREALTDLEYKDGTLLVTGLSNEEFSSKLRKFGFPFSGVAGGTNVEIFHGAHGRWETNAPVRTMTFYDIDGETNILAAYTCTPLVKFPMKDLANGKKVNGTTIAELGNRNRPLDMIVYQKNGKDFVLMANSSRGVMKIDLTEVDVAHEITERVPDKAGLPYETLSELQGVVQLARFDSDSAIILTSSDAGTALRTIALP